MRQDPQPPQTAPEVAFLRVPLDRQVKRQAPPGAVAYRLVLPTHSHTAPPQIAPAPDASGALRCWRLDPFQLPDDVRLRDGQLYRILWVDQHGGPIPPLGTRQLPALRFFLGPPESRAARQQRRIETLLRHVSDPAERSRHAAELARLQLETLQQRQQHRKWKQEQARARAELRQNAAQQQMLSQQMREVREANERSLAQLREQRAQQDAAQASRSKRDALISVGLMVGFPIVTTAFVALIKKLRGEPADWPASWESVLSAWSERAGASGLSPQASMNLASTASTSSLATLPAAAPPSSTAAAPPSTTAAAPAAVPAPSLSTRPAAVPAMDAVPASAAMKSDFPSSRAPDCAQGAEVLSPAEQALVNRVLSDPSVLAALGYELSCALSPQWVASEPSAQALKQLGEEHRPAVRELVGNPRLLEYVARHYAARFGQPWPFPSSLAAEPTGTQMPAVPPGEAEPDPLPAAGGADGAQPHAAVAATTDGATPPRSDRPGESSPVSGELSASERETLTDAESAKLRSRDDAPTATFQLDPALPEQVERALCAVVLDPEMQAQLRFEQRAVQARAAGKPAPAEPITEITAAERDMIRRLASDTAALKLLPRLQQVFQNACQQGAQALFQLPPPLPSLRTTDKKWLDPVRFIPGRAVYLEYLKQHQQALLQGQPVPREPEHHLSAKQRHLLKQVARDLRAQAYVEQTEASRPLSPRESMHRDDPDAAVAEPAAQSSSSRD